MNVKLDENMPASLADALRALGHDVETVPGEGLAGAPDVEVLHAAWTEERFLITQDIEFSAAAASIAGRRPGVLLVRLRRPGRRALADRVARVFRHEDVASWAGATVVLSETKIRIRRGPVPPAG